MPLRLDQPLPPAATRVYRLFGHCLNRVGSRVRLPLVFGRRRFQHSFVLAEEGQSVFGFRNGRRRLLTRLVIGGRTGLLSGAIAAFGLGIVQAVALVFLPSGWQDAVVFALLFLVIALRPDGVFGRTFRW